MRRMSYLLTKAADALDDGEDPLALHFLNEHDVTIDECYDMADKLAAGARLIAWATEHPRETAKFLEAGSAGMALDAITRAMAAIRVNRAGE